MGRYEVLFTDSNCYYVKGTNLLLLKSALTKDNTNDSVLVQLKFKSFYDNNIASLLVVVKGLDLEGAIVEEKEFQYMDLNISKLEEFGDRVPIYLDHNTIRKYNVRVRKIIFRDGSAKTIDDGDCAKVPANAFPFEGEIKEQYIRNIRVSGKGTPSAQHIPLRFGSFWMCSCGEINSESDSECRTCRCLSESLFKNLDIDVLTKDLTEHKQVEAEKAKEKKEKQASIIKKAAVACAALLVTIMAVTCFKNVISPAMKYSKAEKSYEEGNYEDAITEMSELGDYKDATEKIKKYKYDQALALLEKGDKKGAKALFESITGYSDAKEKYEEIIKEEEYENAVVRVKSGQYDKALKHDILTISDDGFGMSKDDIENKWIIIGIDEKTNDYLPSEEDRFGKAIRVPLGEKGIGRLSIAYLGSHMLLLSKKENRKISALLMNWSLLENSNLYIDDVEIPIDQCDSVNDLKTVAFTLNKQFLNNLGKTYIQIKDNKRLVNNSLCINEKGIEVVGDNNGIISVYEKNNNSRLLLLVSFID